MKVLAAALEAIHQGNPAVLCTVIGTDGSAPREGSARMLVYPDQRIVGTIGGGVFELRVIEEAVDALQSGQHRRYSAHLTRDLGMCCGGQMEVFLEVLEVQSRVHVFGAGHVGKSVAEILASMDFDVRVYDEREEWLGHCERDGVTCIPGDPRKAVPTLSPLDYVVILTHSHPLDQDLLEAMITQDFAYLGMIGSKTKVAKFFLRLKASGLDEAHFQNVSAPIGLDIGAETPEEIAVSIVAEIIRVRRRQGNAVIAMSEHPVPARGGDGVATPPALRSRGQ